MKPRFAPALVIVLLLAGCLDGHNEPKLDGPSPSATFRHTETMSGSTGLPSPPPNGNSTQMIALDGCRKGINAAIYVPQALYPNAVPPEASWAANSPLLVMTVEVHECQRISVGPFERGPIHFLLEYHDNVDAPASCRAIPGDYTSDDALSQMWLDDPDIVSYLQTTYRLPIRFASVNVTQVALGPETRDHWIFGLPGEANSSLEAMIGGNDTTSFPVYRLYYSPTMGKISFVDYSVSEKFEGLRNPLVTGKLAPPLLYASTGTGDVVAYGSPSRDGHYSAQIHQFGDDQCKEPL